MVTNETVKAAKKRNSYGFPRFDGAWYLWEEKTQMDGGYMDFVLDTLVPLLKDIAVILTAVVASYVGLKGLSAWKRQLAGQAEYDLAKKILAALYKLKYAVEDVRNFGMIMILSIGLDLPKDEPGPLGEAERKWSIWAQEYNSRWAPVQQARSELQVNLFEAEAVWGAAFMGSISKINPLIVELDWAIRSHVDSQKPNPRDRAVSDDELKKQRERLMCAPIGDGEEDAYSRKLKSAIEEVEMKLKPHIGRTHS